MAEKQPIPQNPDGSEYFPPPPPPGPPPHHHDAYAANQPPSEYPQPPPNQPAYIGQDTEAYGTHDGADEAPPYQEPSYDDNEELHHHDEYTIPDYDPAHPHYAPVPEDAAEHGGADSNTSIPTGAGGSTRKTTRWAGKIANMGIKAADPINALAHKMGSHSFMPMTMEKECEKAAVILRSFCSAFFFVLF